MNKGLIVIIAIGLAFMYFAINITGIAEETTPGLESSQSKRAKEYAAYYKTDFNGDAVLDLSKASLAKSKEVWRTSPIKDSILGYFPDFDTMRQMLENQLVDSEFKTFLIKKLNEVEGDYTSGAKNSDQAKKALMNLQ